MSDHYDNVRIKLLKQYPPAEQGIWQIFGEDPNCDFGGPHVEPMLGTVQGDYASAVEYALGLRNFFTWGAGGRVERVQALKVDAATIKQRAILSSRRTTLKAQLADVEAELKKLGVD